MDTESAWEKAMKRKTNFCLIQGHRVASCKALYLPLGSVFLLDILSLMNCHSSHLRSYRGSRPLPGHTHSSLPANRHTPVVQHPLHSSCQRSSSAGIFVCVLPSLISEHTHLFTCDRQPLLLGPRHRRCLTPRPCLLQRPQTSVCCEACEQESWGNFRVNCWNRTRGPPSRSYITVRDLAVCSHEEHNSLLQMHAELSYHEHEHYMHTFFYRPDRCRSHLLQISK